MDSGFSGAGEGRNSLFGQAVFPAHSQIQNTICMQEAAQNSVCAIRTSKISSSKSATLKFRMFCPIFAA
jgi:hypothetical protein